MNLSNYNNTNEAFGKDNSNCKQMQLDLAQVASVLTDEKKPMKARFRALFILRNIGGQQSIDTMKKVINEDDSALLKHEVAYCLGQMQDVRAVPILIDVLDNLLENAMVRHEAGEALGAIGGSKALEAVRKHINNDNQPEVVETCQLAEQRINWIDQSSLVEKDKILATSPYKSVDPAPPYYDNTDKSLDVKALSAILKCQSEDLWIRYRAMFALRNIGNRAALEAIGEALNEDKTSALFRHECAYVLGQAQHSCVVRHLWNNLDDLNENPMVRHECAEAIGAIAAPPCEYILQQYLLDKDRVVRESCEVALDICDYEKSHVFQYAAV